MVSPQVVSENATGALPAADAALFTETLAPLARAAWWLRACAVFNGLLGLLLTLSIIGIPFGAALGWVAFLEFRAATRLDAARRDPAGQGLAQAEGAMRDIALHYIIQAVLSTLMIVLTLLLFALLAPLLGQLGTQLN